MTNNIEIRRRRLKYRTSHTGTKETDILLGSFVEVFIESLDESEIQDFEDLLSIGKCLLKTNQLKMDGGKSLPGVNFLNHYCQKMKILN